jgi:hypothetical protein
MSKMFFDLQDPALAARFYSQPEVMEQARKAMKDYAFLQ